MNFTITTLAASLANQLAAVLPAVTFLEDPAQQSESDMPCMFLQSRGGDTVRRVHAGGGHWERTVRLDLTYLDRYNLPDLQQRYSAVAEALDEALDVIRYADTLPTEELPTPPTVPLHTYERSCSIDLDALHYRFELRVRVEKPESGELMLTLESNIHIKGVSPND